MRREILTMSGAITPGVVNRGLLADHLLHTLARNIADSLPLRTDDLDREILQHEVRRNTLEEGHYQVLVHRGQPVALLAKGNRFTVDTLAHKDRSYYVVAKAVRYAKSNEIAWVLLESCDGFQLLRSTPYSRQGQYWNSVDKYLAVFPKDLEEPYISLGQLSVVPEIFTKDGVLDDLLGETIRYKKQLLFQLDTSLREQLYPMIYRAISRSKINSSLSANLSPEFSAALTMKLIFRLLLEIYLEEIQKPKTQEFPATLFDVLANNLKVLDRNTEHSALLWENILSYVSSRAVVTPSQEAIRRYLAFSTGEISCLKATQIDDRHMTQALRSLIHLDSRECIAVDYKVLDERDFGDLYEDLLKVSESESSAETTLMRNDQISIDETKSSAKARASKTRQKTTGAYFTPLFLVDYLVESSVLPALKEHLKEIKSLIKEDHISEAARRFYDFKVADLAMGTGHFLVSTIDAISATMAEFLEEYRIEEVEVELENLLATNASRDSGSASLDHISITGALRYLVSQRCIYGVDINRFTVDLARAIVAVHTLAPVPPIWDLKDHMVTGNSLLGLSKDQEIMAYRSELPDDLYNDLSHLLRGDLNNLYNVLLAGLVGLIDIRELQRIVDAEDQGKLLMLIEEIDSQQPVHFPSLFPKVFQRCPEGFDVVIGNPPFQSQLNSYTAAKGLELSALRHLYPEATKLPFDRSTLFLLRALSLTRSGGWIAQVQPISLLATQQAGFVRSKMLESTTLRAIWIGTEKVFDASVATCAVIAQNFRSDSYTVSRTLNSTLTRLAPLEVGSGSDIDISRTWGQLASGIDGAPTVYLRRSLTVGSLATASADFRDQYYGLRDYVCEYQDLEDEAYVKLITSGLIDPFRSLWGLKTTRFNHVRYLEPAVNITRSRRDLFIDGWIKTRLVPKLLVATQGKVIEVLPDEIGELLPSVPVVTVLARSDTFYLLAAALGSPPVSLFAKQQYYGTALATSAIKLSAKQILDLPLPQDQKRWERSAELAAELFRNNTETDLDVWQEYAAVATEAYGQRASQISKWWLDIACPSKTRDSCDWVP
jgi:hypothetical protein